ncbi:heterogeneous nuclear ribonucleoprotein 1-like isoform X1 [Miscanthus floridulus]|uniref:heterogeneous nuclear ribonucleoprotein 1-like isoform X1 n=2 Tax=Miscanthus floridulus TaxID=154761 RepID=UPI0034579F94
MKLGQLLWIAGGGGGEGRTDTMEADSGKLFVGGISWETDEDRLREYFGRFGEVTEAVIMRDRNTGRARGFGFVVFADYGIAERVTMDKHMIDGRMVEAKKAVPRDDQSIASKNNGSSIGSPGPGRTRKIFVGGLASNVTEVEFRRYFEQFGVITDVVVMYDHNTQRPRGFGFITYDSEDAVDKALHKNFHELNGKMVEVKRAVPKEQSPGPIARSPAGGQNYAMSRVHNFLNGFNQGYSPNPLGGYGMRVDGRYGLLTGARNGFSSFGPGYGMGMNVEGGMSGYFGASSGFVNSSNGRQIGSYFNGSSNRLGSPIGYVGLNDDSGSILSSMSRNVWGNGNLNYTGNPTNTNSFAPPGSGGGIPGDEISWGSLTSAHGMGNISNLGSGNLVRGTGDNNFGLPSGNYVRSNSTGTIGEPFSASANAYESNNPGAYGSSSIYGDSTWRFNSSEVDMPPFGHDLGNVDPDIKSEISASYMGNYTVNNNQTSRGITS